MRSYTSMQQVERADSQPEGPCPVAIRNQFLLAQEHDVVITCPCNGQVDHFWTVCDSGVTRTLEISHGASRTRHPGLRSSNDQSSAACFVLTSSVKTCPQILR